DDSCAGQIRDDSRCRPAVQVEEHAVRRLDAQGRGGRDAGRRQGGLCEWGNPGGGLEVTRREQLRSNTLMNLREHEGLMLDGHFDYGNGSHGSVYLNPHKIFRQPSLIWRFAQDLIELLPDAVVAEIDVVSGPVMGGALFAHTVAGLLDGRRALSHAPTSFAPLSLDGQGTMILRPFYRTVVAGKRVMFPDDVRNTGETFLRAKAAIEGAGGKVIATAEICDRLESQFDLGVPNFALAEYRAPENFPVASCPLCKAGREVTAF